MLLRCLSTLQAFVIKEYIPIAWMTSRISSSHFAALETQYVSYKVFQLYQQGSVSSDLPRHPYDAAAVGIHLLNFTSCTTK